MGHFPIIPLYFVKKLYLCTQKCCVYSAICREYESDAYRCSLENFALLENQDVQDDNAVRRIAINPLYAISNLCK